MAQLLDLPEELLLEIAKAVELPKDLSAFSRTCRRFFNATNPLLYRLDAQQFGSSALFWASEHGEVEVACKSLAQGANAGATLEDGSQPLLLAARNGHEAMMRLLLGQENVNPNCQDDCGRAPLLWAAAGGHEAAVRALLEQRSVDRNLTDNCVGPSSGSWDLGACDVTEQGGTPLWCAAINGHKRVVELLLADERVDPDKFNINRRTALSVAATNGHRAIVELLLARGDVNHHSCDITGITPLSYAARSGHEEVVKMLLQKGDGAPGPADNCSMPISLAAQNGHMAVVRLLLEQQPYVDPNAKDYSGRTVLSWIAGYGCEETLDMLLAKDGVLLNSWDEGALRTPLSWAVEKGNAAVVRKLLALGPVHQEWRDKSGRSPLFLAVEKGHEEVVRLLLDVGKANPDTKDRKGCMAFSVAMANGFENIATMLAARGATIIPNVSTGVGIC